jgi:hypothetical protein
MGANVDSAKERAGLPGDMRSHETRFSYQSVIHPALEPDIDHACVFSLRIRTTF